MTSFEFFEEESLSFCIFSFSLSLTLFHWQTCLHKISAQHYETFGHAIWNFKCVVDGLNGPLHIYRWNERSMKWNGNSACTCTLVKYITWIDFSTFTESVILFSRTQCTAECNGQKCCVHKTLHSICLVFFSSSFFDHFVCFVLFCFQKGDDSPLPTTTTTKKNPLAVNVPKWEFISLNKWRTVFEPVTISTDHQPFIPVCLYQIDNCACVCASCFFSLSLDLSRFVCVFVFICVYCCLWHIALWVARLCLLPERERD